MAGSAGGGVYRTLITPVWELYQYNLQVLLMPGIFPETIAGGVVVRDASGNCLSPANVSGAYCPPATFVMDCPMTALPSDCTARLEPRQLNAIISELVSFAECMDPNGPWTCAQVNNLCSAFNAYQISHKIVNVGDTPPASPIDNTSLWWESDSGIFWLYYYDGNTRQWVQVGGQASKALVAINDLPPLGPVHGQLWWESDTGILGLYYDDGNSQQWVQM